MDENRHVVTFRLMRSLVEHHLKLSLIGFYSPSDDDGYLRPMIRYQIDDDWAIDGGVNWLFGESEQTLFGQLENNTNVYVGVRYRFSAQ